MPPAPAPLLTANSAEILPMGDPRLRAVSAPVGHFAAPELADATIRLSAALQRFRRTHGFGRAIAAPQLGIRQRFIALHLPHWPGLVFNPRITWHSTEKLILWDDCMCFPFLLVRLQRAASISIHFQDAQGRDHIREGLEPAIAELLQHEIDHLDGVLAVDHALGKDALVSREAFDSNPEYFYAQVNFQP